MADSGERTFTVVGMMNSGTNLAKELLVRFGRGVRYLDPNPRVWKHTTHREDIETLAEADMVFVCVRHPLLVLHSTLRRPHVLSCTSVADPAKIVPRLASDAHRYRRKFRYMVHYYDDAMAFYGDLVRALGEERCVIVEYERLLTDPDTCLGVTVGAAAGLETPARPRMGHVGARDALAKARRAEALFPPADVDFVVSNLAPNPFYGVRPSPPRIVFHHATTTPENDARVE